MSLLWDWGGEEDLSHVHSGGCSETHKVQAGYQSRYLELDGLHTDDFLCVTKSQARCEVLGGNASNQVSGHHAKYWVRNLKTLIIFPLEWQNKWDPDPFY